MHRTWALIALVAVVACSSDAERPLELTRLSTFTDSLGLVTGATFGEAGSIYVADVTMKAVFRIDDSTAQNLFPNGEGPGEVVQPRDVSYDDGTLSVLDRGKGGTSIFSGLEFVTFRPEDFGPGTRYITETDEIENPLSALLPSQSESGQPVTDVYTNSGRHRGRTYEMSVVDGSTLLVQSEEVHFTKDAVIVPLGIACSDELVVLGYGIAGRLFYRFYDLDMELIGSREFATPEEPDVLGLIFALRGDTLLTGRNRPLPRVELWLVEH
jgi:hypothetical protein